MPLAPGTRLGPYEILSPLGAGGMGEVYKAKDTRLGRSVAIKVLLGQHAEDRTMRERFEREAQAISALSHPSICTLHDIGEHEGTHYLVMEYLEGETLAARLARERLPLKEALELGREIAVALAAAHGRGIVHRDLKPSNVMLTKSGPKLLDFGLAKLHAASHGIVGLAGQETASGPLTEQGEILGTLQYMAPEQLEGREADARSDIFAFGCLLYEMISGRRPFSGLSQAGVIAATLKEDPAELSEPGRDIPLALEHIVNHCLEKDPAQRFESMRDIVFDLSNLAEGPTSTPRAARAEAARRSRRLRRLGVAALVLALAGAAFWLGTRLPHASAAGGQSEISFQTVSFGRGIIDAARFTPDGQTVVYGAAWDGGPFRLNLTRPGSPASSALGLPDADLLAVSPKDELAIALDYRLLGWMGRGTLARVPMLGAGPRQVADDVLAADWSPDGSGLAIVRWAGGRKRLEYPVGKVLAETEGWISHPRFSSDGTRLAFIDHPVDGDDRGSVALLDLQSDERRTLSGEWSGVQGLAWAPSGTEVFFSAYDGATPQSVYAVDLQGRRRQLLTAPTGLFLQDVARDGRLLVASQTRTIQILVQLEGNSQPRDLSWLSYSFAEDISADGRLILLECGGDSCGNTYTVLVRGTDGSPAVRLGEGSAQTLSPDGKFAAALVFGPHERLVLYPLGAGQPRTVELGQRAADLVGWLPDGRGLVVLASEPGHGKRGYTVDLEAGSWHPFTPEGVSSVRRLPVAPAGDAAVMADSSGRLSLFPLDGGPARAVRGAEAGDEAIRFSVDGRALYVTRREVPLRIFKIDLASGRRELWRELPAPDPAGLQASWPAAVISADGRSVVGTYTRRLNKLYVVSGVR